MSLRLHNPANQAHIEELKDRLRPQLALMPHTAFRDSEQAALLETLVGVVRAMDQGLITTQAAIETFTRRNIPGFSFVKWLVDMVDEDVYLDTQFDETSFRKAA